MKLKQKTFGGFFFGSNQNLKWTKLIKYETICFNSQFDLSWIHKCVLQPFNFLHPDLKTCFALSVTELVMTSCANLKDNIFSGLEK